MLSLNTEHLAYKEAKKLLETYNLPYINVTVCTFRALASEQGRTIDNMDELSSYVENVKGGFGEG